MAKTDLGQILDSWSELLDNHGGQEAALKEKFAANITGRQIPGVENTDEVLSMNGLSRGYRFSARKSGATVTTNINKYGTDLFIKWTLWWKPRWDWKVIFGILAVAFVFGLIPANSVPSYYGSGAAFGAFFMAFFSTLITLLILVGVAGFFLRGSVLGFFLTEFNLFNQDDAIALSFAVDHSLRQAADTIGIKIQLRERTDFYTGKRGRLI